MIKRLHQRGLTFKMIIYIFTSIAIVLCVILVVNYKYSQKMLRKNIEESARNLNQSIVNRVEVVLTSVEKLPRAVAHLVEHGQYTPERLKNVIRLLVKNNPEIYGMTIAFEPYAFDKSQRYFAPYYYKSGDEIKYASLASGSYSYLDKDWYIIPKELDKPHWSEPYYDEGGGNIIMSTFSAPIYKTIDGERRFIGIITADMSLEWLQQIVNSIKVLETGYGFTLTTTGQFITHPLPEVIMNETIFSVAEERGYPSLREIGREMIQGKSGFKKPDYKSLKGGQASWISYSPIKMNGWSLGIVYPLDELLNDVRHLTIMMLLLGLGGLIFIGFMVALISSSITKPLRHLDTAAKDLAAGKFDIELPHIESRDEIGRLNQSFIAMQSALRDTINKLKDANEALEDYSRNLEAKVEQRTHELSQKNKELDASFKNVKTLSDIGQKITSTLNLELIFNTVYENVNTLLDATTFLIMIHNEKEQQLECRLAIKKGERLPLYIQSMNEKNRLAVWSAEHREPIFMNDVAKESVKYVTFETREATEETISSLIYLPLIVEQRLIGVISVQSYKKNAYTQYHFDILQNLATYTAIALDNAFAYEAINRANRELKEAQAQLVQSEKMASLGQLTAGIAHEIKNPLNFVNNFSELSIDLTKELTEEIDRYQDKFEPKMMDYFHEVLGDLEHNVRKINEHGKRADSIVKGMLLHSRGKPGEMQKADINNLVQEYLNLAYHGFRAQDSTFNVKLETNYDATVEPINIVPQNLSRVFLNIINNACYSVHEKKKERGEKFAPVVSVTTKNLGEKVEVVIRDNGKGIPQDIIDKIFNPFFTTKPTGKGTGLGLSMSYDIVVQEHKGELKVTSEIGEYAEFCITIPKNLA
ncbi:MAG: ATP-binding protein [Candidatus Neomarinimicrobiota bacterium]